MAPSRNVVPNRWLDYADHGSHIPGTRFVPFKGLGIVIDLTNTDRYYDHNCVVSHGVAHAKIRCPSACVPNERVVKSFFAAVGEFIAKPDNDDKLVGVHRTHGVNRTGYVVCRYMVDKLGIAPATAIEGFQKARRHNFDKQEYVSNLRARRLQSPK